MIVLSDSAFFAKEGDPVNLKLCDRGLCNTWLLCRDRALDAQWCLSSQESLLSDMGRISNTARLYAGDLQSPHALAWTQP